MSKLGWSKPPSGFVKEVEQELNKQLRATALQVLEGVIMRSPVSTGRFRANNTVTVGAPAEGYDLDARQPSPPQGAFQGVGAYSDGFRVIGKVDSPYEIIWISNNLPYAEVLEGGSSKQAEGPGAIYQRTIDSLGID